MKKTTIVTAALAMAMAFTGCSGSIKALSGKTGGASSLPSAHGQIEHSTSVETPYVGELTSFGSVIEWMEYSLPVAGSQLTVEYNLSPEANEALLEEINSQSGTEFYDQIENIDMYLVKAENGEISDISNPLARFDGYICTHFTNVETYETEYVVRYDEFIPADITTGEYVLVFAREDGTVDSYMDIYIVGSVAEATEMGVIAESID